MRVMIVVTHLLGTGHLARALTLGRAFAKAGDSVMVVSGGGAVSHFDTSGLALAQLPAVRSDGTDFTTLMTDHGVPVDPDYMGERQRQLIGELNGFAPDVLITELFPFGRRILRNEFRALLEAAQHCERPPLVLCSIRDILAPPGKPEKAQFADDMIAQFYDGVLVHSDDALVPLDLSWPVSAALAKCLHYTGFVAPPAPAPAMYHGEVLVSAGGGPVGDGIFKAARDAAVLTPDITWRCLVAGDAARVKSFADEAPSNMSVEGARSDFRSMLTGAAASVSMCGYNTAMDVLETGVPAVLVPFDEGGELEQGLRADALGKLPGIRVLPQDRLDGHTLVAALEHVRHAPPRPPREVGMDGAVRSVEIVHDLYRGAKS
jgi:predicted glycosyltransferase